MNARMSSKRSPLLFFVLVFALSIPFWVLSAIFPMNLPVDNLPVTDIGATFVPLIAASILVYREEKLWGVRNLWKRTFDYKRITQKIRYVPIIFLMPFIYVLTYGVMRLVGLPVPTEWHIPLLTPLLFIAFFLAAAGKELGYTGYATDPMQVRYTALTASLIMGSIHAVWHYPSMIQIGQTPGLMVWGTLLTISFRILTVWLYNNTGNSVFVAILFHAVTNTGRSVFPGGRSAYELDDAAVGYAIITITAVIVVFLCILKFLTRYRRQINGFVYNICFKMQIYNTLITYVIL
jgi:membrane protease YdiL (CAAX protease family)